MIDKIKVLKDIKECKLKLYDLNETVDHYLAETECDIGEIYDKLQNFTAFAYNRMSLLSKALEGDNDE